MSLASGGALASVVTYSDSIAYRSTSWIDAIDVPQFDDFLGTLNSVRIVLTGDVLQRFKVENTGASADVITPLLGARLMLRHAGSLVSGGTLALSREGGSFNAARFDGAVNYSGASGIDFGDLFASGSLTLTFTSGLADFIGSGSLASYFDVRAVASGVVESDNGNFISSIRTQSRYSINVTYNYTSPVFLPDSQVLLESDNFNLVPEPGAVALLALGVLTGTRRRIYC